MTEGPVPSGQDELGSRTKEHLLRLAKKCGVSVTLPAARPGQVCALPVTFSSEDGNAVCVALIPAKTTPEEELRIIARNVAYVIARAGGGGSEWGDSERREQVILERARALAMRSSGKG